MMPARLKQGRHHAKDRARWILQEFRHVAVRGKRFSSSNP
jgi:hypothetical protein